MAGGLFDLKNKTMKTLKITPGKWNIEYSDFTIRSKQFGISDCMGDYRGNIIASIAPSLGVVPNDGDEDWHDRYEKGLGGRMHAYSEVKANAQLIAEAGTVANETGLTPRELLEQRNELLEALKGIERLVDNQNESHESIWRIAYAAIQKATS